MKSFVSTSPIPGQQPPKQAWSVTKDSPTLETILFGTNISPAPSVSKCSFSCFEVRVRLLGNRLHTFKEKMCIVVALVLGRLHQVLLLAWPYGHIEENCY